jgi:hypothetical protein
MEEGEGMPDDVQGRGGKVIRSVGVILCLMWAIAATVVATVVIVSDVNRHLDENRVDDDNRRVSAVMMEASSVSIRPSVPCEAEKPNALINISDRSSIREMRDGVSLNKTRPYAHNPSLFIINWVGRDGTQVQMTVDPVGHWTTPECPVRRGPSPWLMRLISRYVRAADPGFPNADWFCQVMAEAAEHE